MRNINKLKILYSFTFVVFAFFAFSSKAFAVTYSATGTNQTGTYQTYTVPSTGTYTIEAWGAEGGNYASSGFANGGKGAYMKGDFSLTAGTVLQILVGQKPADSSGASGGGGGTFVAQGASYPSATLLLAAGGGGGRGSSVGGANLPDGNVTTTGSNATYAGGAGPNGAADAGNSGWGGPGAGFSGNGPTQANYGGTAYSFTNGGTGGATFTCSGYYGGFGGGGGGGCNGGGGGGGYGGGGAGGPGGGGGSYNGGTNQTNTAGLRTGNGQVIITAGGSAASATTTGNGGYSYNYFYSAGTVTNNTGSTAWYGTAWGTSNVGCSSLPNKTDYSTIGTGTNNQSISAYVTASASTTYYFCVYVKDSGNTYYYSPTTSSLTTSAIPAPAVQYPLVSTIDDASADVGIGVISYVSPVTVTARWGTSNVACASLPSSSVATSPGTDVNNSMAYTKRITGLSPSTTYYWCFSAATAQGTTYSSVTSFATTAAAGTSCDLLPSSSLATAGNKTTLAGYLGTTKMQGTLLYKATTNGWAASTFHTNANAQGATLVLVKSNPGSGDQVYGGYNPQSWSSAGSYNYAPNGFLFSLTNGYQLKQATANYQTYNSGTYGPTFGGGHDLGFPNATLNTASAEYDNVSTYENPNTKGAFTYLNGGAGNTFTPLEIEVYKISICTVSAPTVTTPTSASITAISATLGGNVTSGGTQAITARGICYAPTATDADPKIGDPGATCTPEGGTTTGVFTLAVNNLQGNTAYSYNAYATNSVGTGYTLGTFSTLNPAPTTVGTAANGTPQSYYVQLNGSANPNGFQTYGHFRLFTTNPGNCSADSGGVARYPEGTVNFPDLNLGSGSSVVSAPTFSYTIPFNASNWLTPNTTYYYCAYAVNTVNSTNYTTGASGVVSFTTSDGPANPCDPPSSGSLSIPSGAVCNFVGTVGGVDAGTGTRNTAQLTVPATTRLSISAGQKIAFGSVSIARGAILSIARGGSLSGGGVYVHDNDRDNYLDDATQYVGSTASASTEFIRRNAISSIFNYAWKIASSGAMYDCNKNTAYAYRVLPNLVRDADNDGYKTSTAAGPQCVGAAGQFNGRTYYNDGSGPN